MGKFDRRNSPKMKRRKAQAKKKIREQLRRKRISHVVALPVVQKPKIKPRPVQRVAHQQQAAALHGPPAWYVKGSFVLDRVLGTNLARDVDVFSKNGRRPTRDDVEAWLLARGFILPATGSIDLTEVDNLWKCDGAEEPLFNTDCLFIAMDGAIYEFDPVLGIYSRRGVGPLPPITRVTTRLPDARASLKAVVKMLLYPTLKNLQLGEALAGVVATELLNLNVQPH